MRSNHVIGGDTSRATSTSSPSEPSPRLVMAVMAVGMIAGALLTSPGKPAGPAADLARATTPTAQTGGSQ